MSRDGDDVEEPYKPLSSMLHSVIVRTYGSGAISRGFAFAFGSNTTTCGPSGWSGSPRRVCDKTTLYTVSCTVSTRVELVALAMNQFSALINHQRVGVEQLVAAFSLRTFTWRALHCRQPSRLFLWPRRGIDVSRTSDVALKVALPRSGWVTLDAATRWCRCCKANARRGGKA